MEREGKPTVLIVAKGFEADARFNAQHEGLSDLPLVVLPQAVVPLPQEIAATGLGKTVATAVVNGLTREATAASSTEAKTAVAERLTFRGESYDDAVASMERFFLQNCWSDGLPLIPPAPEAVNWMLEATELSPQHVLGTVEPGGNEATIEKVAVNAVMAGCLPTYFPVVVAAVEAMVDPRFDLRGVQCTAGLVSPLPIVSGLKLIEQLNINDSFSTIGPGWRANATIGRAIRLIMINLGLSWPGRNDMKSFGTPFKYVTLMAENERGYEGVWEPIRVTEGFSPDEATVSLMPACSWGLERCRSEDATTEKMVALLCRQAKAKYDNNADSWGMDDLVLLSPAAFEIFRKEGRSRADIQQAIYENARIPSVQFFGGREPSDDYGPKPLPRALLEQCRRNPQTMVPLLEKPEGVKIVVAGGPGPRMMAYVGNWGFGPAYFVTKPVKLPANWTELLKKYQGWETPVIR
ncbi:hypothetical protein ACFLWN_02930 [Chloroflexota bacterium]